MNAGPPVPSWLADYTALNQGSALVDMGARTRIELTGPDRATFLHNLCTNEVRRLPAGAGCEAFFTTVQGKTLGHGAIFAGTESLWIDTVPGQNARLLAHLDHYLVSEQVTLADRTTECAALLLAGPLATETCRRVGGPVLTAARLAHGSGQISGWQAWIARVDWTGAWGYLISVALADLPAVRASLLQAGADPCSNEAFEAARIEAGYPWFGRDISDANLPQEIARDPLAISFVKGCYLGQETVARIDALGHVNRTLVGLRFDSRHVPETGGALHSAEQEVGQITSASYSPRVDAAIGLGFVRRGSNTPLTVLQSLAGSAQVVPLPFA